MARKVRIEEPGSFYHLINRGNYRAWIFETGGARKAFRRCLVEVCQSHGWRLHAWVLMSNHYHLLVETPEGNLVSGMRWLNSTFANWFNRFRNENGHVFQGRYKSILLEPDAVPSVAHYIHLNPVRADVIKPENLEQFVDSSFHHLWHAKRRWSFECFADVLDSLGLIGFDTKTSVTDSPKTSVTLVYGNALARNRCNDRERTLYKFGPDGSLYDY